MVSVSVLHFYVVSALNFGVIPCKGYISTTECEHSPFFWKLCRNYFRIIFTENKLKRKRADGKSAKAEREQVFLSESGIVESFQTCLLPGAVHYDDDGGGGLVVVTTVAEVAVTAMMMMMV